MLWIMLIGKALPSYVLRLRWNWLGQDRFFPALRLCDSVCHGRLILLTFAVQEGPDGWCPGGKLHKDRCKGELNGFL
jgi:hypothetical protein